MPNDNKKKPPFSWALNDTLDQATDASTGSAPQPKPAAEPDDRGIFTKGYDWLVDAVDPSGAAKRAQERKRQQSQTSRYRAK